MLALDTNILVQYFARSIPAQAEAARSLIDSLTPESAGFVCREVTLETVWVLDRVYNFSRVEIYNAIANLIDLDGIVLENAEDVRQAVIRYRQSSDDFPDLLILAAAQRAHATPLYTFDRRLARLQGATLLTAPQSSTRP